MTTTCAIATLPPHLRRDKKKTRKIWDGFADDDLVQLHQVIVEDSKTINAVGLCRQRSSTP